MRNNRNDKKIFLSFLLVIISPLLFAVQAPAESQTFEKWLAEVRLEALARGIKSGTLDKAFAGIEPLNAVVELDRQQPEFRLSFREYLDKRVTTARIEQGLAFLKEQKIILRTVSETYGVQPHFLVAIWGVESNYGAIKGNYPLVAALATLAFDGRRTAFFRRQLLDLLQMIDEGHIRNDATGSWAGAMGHTQFMPETYRKHAVDFDKDGRKDLWGSLADVFASSANYLALSGWEKGKGWGREVQLPEGFDYALCDLSIKKTFSEWRKLGVRTAEGGSLPQGSTEASLILPGGADGGPALLVYRNFRVLLEWNRSIFYAVLVGHLADRLTGAPAFREPGKILAALTLAESIELQQLLACWGYYKGEVDGIAGTKTREAIRIFQQENLLPADGYPSLQALEYLRLKSNQI